MEFTGKIVFDASPALLNTANRIADAIAGKSVEPQIIVRANANESPAATPTEQLPPIAEPAAPVSEPAPTVHREPKCVAAPAAPNVTLEQLRAVIGEKSKAGKKKEVKAIILSLGTDSATNMDPAKYGEAFVKISAL